jgi:sugar (pentulose or hexulose) kinase
MHGEVLVDGDEQSLGPARLWCDGRNEIESEELTNRFGVKMPKRMTVVRWLWTIRQHSEKAKKVVHITTPAGWLAFQLTGEWSLGIGDASGMFPIDQSSMDYDRELVRSFDKLTVHAGVMPLRELLPPVRKAGESGGSLTDLAAKMLGLQAGIPVAPAEGDQPTALAGSLIGSAGMVSVSFGTSVCANSIGDHSFKGGDRAVDHFCAADGKPINMVWLRNGTTYMNSLVKMFGMVAGGNQNSGFAAVMPKVLDAAPDCGGVLALPFMDDEPGLGIHSGGTAGLFGLNAENATPGNTVKAALLATMFNLRLGSEVLDDQRFPRSEIVLSGGLCKTPELGQILANVFDTHVSLMDASDEGTAWGAAVLANYRYRVLNGDRANWSSFLNSFESSTHISFGPTASLVRDYEATYGRYKTLLASQPVLDKALDAVK